MGNILVTGDTHWGHLNIIKYCKRPFSSVEEMDEMLIQYWNAKVKPNDTVWHLGDFSFKGKEPREYFNKLNGKILFTIGNHDKRHSLQELAPVYDRYDLKPDPTNKRLMYVLSHYAQRVWNKSHHGTFHLYGHSHDTLEKEPWGRSMDVGVDPANRILGRYEPFAIEEVYEILSKREVKVVDHHGEPGSENG
jgi:calcineurin-like phosphoesterase family protein